MQWTLDKLVAWASRWDRAFNINKCRVRHKGKRNLEFQYQMNNGWAKSEEEERDLGVLMSMDLKFLKQCLLKKK